MRNMMGFSHWMRGGCVALVVSIVGGTLAVADAPKRPNVLLITTDQQKGDALGVAGNRWAKTPNMDSIAAQGVYFSRSYCSYPLCSPSRGSLHTGRMPHEIGVDGQVGRVLQTLRQTGQEGNTLIVFTSDHGDGLASHRWTGKQMFFEEEVGVPLVIGGKGIANMPAGRIDRTHLVSTLDVLPTICDYAGIKIPNQVRGASLRGVIEDPKRPGHECVVSEMAFGGPGNPPGPGRSFMVRTAKYKYMIFSSLAAHPIEALFDMDADPGETKNLAAEPAMASVLARHRELLAAWKKTTLEDKYPVRPPRQPRAAKKAKKTA